MMALVALLPVAVWLYLLAARGRFWMMQEHDDRDEPPAPAKWPSVVAVVPARNEADVIAQTLASLLAQDYPGSFRVVLVDDQSNDGTAEVARETSVTDRVTLVSGATRPAGWTGKLWAVRQGVSAAGTPDYLWLTDADIAHSPDNLRRLVARAEANKLVLTSLMAKLHCQHWYERYLIPAFVFFFAMLYPFRWVNDPRTKTAAAAGGCMLVRREALERAGDIDAIRSEIIDDCALARTLKSEGPIWLGLTERATSVRPYRGMADIRAMVARSAFAQLGYSSLALAGTVAGMIVVYAAPPLLALLAHDSAQASGILAWAAMALAFQPILNFYRLSPLWGLALPLIGAVYAVFTFDSALQHWLGRGGMWKGRAQAMGRT
ncbi:MAG TPA: glycosyltransferase [Rhizomicrobium sp.]|jgi:hopene-associated glycosyltransferase HpnB